MEGRSGWISTVLPSGETFTQRIEGRGCGSVASPGTGTNGAATGLGRSSKQDPSALYAGPGEHVLTPRAASSRRTLGGSGRAEPGELRSDLGDLARLHHDRVGVEVVQRR